jgi:Domain of Unknown Function (DUF1080)
MRTHLQQALVIAIFAFGGAVSLTRGADRPIPSLPPLDDDFSFQGEFAGAVAIDTTTRWIGLQVVALGQGEFQGVEFAGGLPGNGGANDRRRKFSGHRAAENLVLEGDGRRLTIDRKGARVADTNGRLLGRLTKLHRLSRTMGAQPPAGALVLFDGTSASRFQDGALTADQLLNVGADTRDAFGDFTLHVEFRTPYMPQARGQGRGNSGVYLQGRYEVQILDSFGLEGLDNECAALYKTRAPLLNMCFPPMSWQTYDIAFVAARFDEQGVRVRPARITVKHNGIVVHKDFAIPGKTGAGAEEGPDARPIRLQNHGDAVHYRNLWIVSSAGADSLRDCPDIRWSDACIAPGDCDSAAEGFWSRESFDRRCQFPH